MYFPIHPIAMAYAVVKYIGNKSTRLVQNSPFVVRARFIRKYVWFHRVASSICTNIQTRDPIFLYILPPHKYSENFHILFVYGIYLYLYVYIPALKRHSQCQWPRAVEAVGLGCEEDFSLVHFFLLSS